MKNTTAFRPNKGRYLVLPSPVEAQTTKIEGSEYEIESQKNIHEKPAEGTVVAKGKDCTEYEPGAVVLFGKFSGYEQTFDGQNYLILAETEILGERLVTPFDDEPGATTEITVRRGQSLKEAVEERLVDEAHECAFCRELATTATQTCDKHVPQ